MATLGKNMFRHVCRMSRLFLSCMCVVNRVFECLIDDLLPIWSIQNLLHTCTSQNIFQKRDLLGPRTHQKKAACNFSDVCSKSCFWMFDWWFQKLGGSEPTPDGLALTFEFVRSKKRFILWWKHKEQLSRPPGEQKSKKIPPVNPRRSLFENCFKSYFDTARWWEMSCAFDFLRNYWFIKRFYYFGEESRSR